MHENDRNPEKNQAKLQAAFDNLDLNHQKLFIIALARIKGESLLTSQVQKMSESQVAQFFQEKTKLTTLDQQRQCLFEVQALTPDRPRNK